jgi:hypothetical protein
MESPILNVSTSLYKFPVVRTRMVKLLSPKISGSLQIQVILFSHVLLALTHFPRLKQWPRDLLRGHGVAINLYQNKLLPKSSPNKEVIRSDFHSFYGRISIVIGPYFHSQQIATSINSCYQQSHQLSSWLVI